MDYEKVPELGRMSSSSTLSMAAQVRLEKLHYERELRRLEMLAYAGVLEALRASGKPNVEKEGLIKTLRDYFHISEERHKAEIRLLAFDSNLSLICTKLTGYNFTEEWAFQAQHVYVPLGPQAFTINKKSKPGTASRRAVIRDPVPSGRVHVHEEVDSSDSDSYSESELEAVENLIQSCMLNNGWPDSGKHNKVLPETATVDQGTGNEKEIEEIEQHMKKGVKGHTKKPPSQAKSPDITEAPRTPIKPIVKEEAKLTTGSVGKARGGAVQRKVVEEIVTTTLLPAPVENSPKLATARKLSEKSKNIIKIKKSKLKLPAARRPQSKRVKESSEETSSADEGENGPMPPEDESSRVMSPVFSEVIRTSVLARGGRGRGLRGRSGTDRRRKNILISASTKPGKSRPRTPNQKSAKFKNVAPTSGSRRKSKLNEKIDYDEVPMELDGNGMGTQQRLLPPHTPNSDDHSRRLLFDSQTYDMQDYKASEDCAVYTESLPVNYYNHGDMEQVTDGVFKRPLPPSKGPKPWEIKDARLNHYLQSQRNESVGDENTDGSVNPIICNDAIQQPQRFSHVSSPHVNSVNDVASSSTPTKLTEPPPSKKQRIKSPLIVNPNINSSPNVAKVPLSAPVFSTLSSVNKKRNNNNNINNSNKPISVVDSLNLHLPTSATASSLAASSNNRRPGGVAPGGGCSMFSNSSALIAGARGTAPGILQQQRKAHPHILSNSKVQRSFLPVVHPGMCASNIVNNIVPISSGTPITMSSSPPNSIQAPATATAHTVQLTASPIMPMSAISSANPSATLPFQSFPGVPPSGITIGTGMPIGHVSRSATGTNIIFVQKGNGPTVSVGGEMPGNIIPLKNQPRAVILRRAQLPRQGNVMILDMQKNQFVSPAPGQTPALLQGARILNAQGELSLVNIQPSTIVRSNGPPTSLAVTATQFISSSPSPIQASQQGPHLQIQASDISVLQVPPTPESFITLGESPSQIAQISTSIVTTPVPISTAIIQQENTQENEDTPSSTTLNNSTNAEVVCEDGRGQDAQYAQIEAELMQMEEGNFGEVIYEEEVTTEIVPLEDNESTQYIYTNEEATSTPEGEVLLVPQESLSHNALTDTAPESEMVLQNFESSANDLNRTKVSLSPTGEVKMASEAISRALTLSKSSAKRLTFSTPISFSTAATIAEKFAISNKASSGIDSVVTASSTQLRIVPSTFQATTATELNPSTVVIGADIASTNSVHLGNSQPGIEFILHNNEIVQNPKQ